MSLLKEFREFAMRGNVVDMAVGVVIGGAFGKIVASLVSDIIMPPLNLLTSNSGMEFKNLALKIKNSQNVETTLLNYGPFIQTIVDFVLVAFAIFMVIKLMNNAKKRFEKEQATAAPPAPPEEVVLLREIRDSLRKK